MLPIYNPYEEWEKDLVRQYKILLTRLPKDLIPKLIMVNDGSSMDLEAGKKFILDEFPEALWISYAENQGKGYALRKGVEKCEADIIMFTDYDFPYTYGSMEKLINKLIDTDADAVIGTRDHTYYNHISGRRRWISQNLKKVNRLLFKLPTDDTQCGLKAFTSGAKETFLKTQTNRYLIDVEFLKKLVKNKSQIETQNVKLRDNVKMSKISNLWLVKEFINYLKIMLS